jgi:hypothetical protein
MAIPEINVRALLFLPIVHNILNDYVLYFFRPIFPKTTTTHQILLEVPSTHPIPPLQTFLEEP